jgi:hypothetical protein
MQKRLAFALYHLNLDRQLQYKSEWASNNALLTDTYTSPLRAQRGAAKRER